MADAGAPEVGEEFQEFVRIIKALRTPVTGCPWDLEQTHESIRRYLVEETYEVLEAIDAKDDHEFAIELGDLLLQVLLHAQIASDRNAFDILTVVRNVSEKIVRRHPHVFGETTVSGTEDVLRNWEKIKLQEKPKERRAGESKLLDGVPRSLPALIRAQRLGEKAAKVSFDWPDLGAVLEKVREELTELSAEIPLGRELEESDRSRVEAELGDLLFAASQLARHCGVSAEDALARGCDRFQKRFAGLEERAGEQLAKLDAASMERLWSEVKKSERT